MVFTIAVVMAVLGGITVQAQQAPPLVDGDKVTDGPVRIEVLAPTLLRLEFAEDRQFENGTTFNVINRDFPVPRFNAEIMNGHLIIMTDNLSFSYKIGSGIFTTQNVKVVLDSGDIPVVAKPDFYGPGITCNPDGGCHEHTNLGGWFESLDGKRDAVAMHDGLLSRDGWFLLNDTQSDLYIPGSWPRARSSHHGEYQDGYFFGYGLDYKRGLQDFVDLTGKIPLLPRWAFGVWLGTCCAYSARDYETKILPAARFNHMPLDVLTIDTQWKQEYSPPNNWNGWEWSTATFPHPVEFIHWATQHSLHIGLNIHPSIGETDPKYPQALRIAGSLLPDPDGLAPKPSFTWGFARPADADSYFDLHQSLIRDGVRFFWLDACCGEGTSSGEDVTPRAWLNELYVRRATPKGKRGFVLARIGGTNMGYGSSDVTPTGPWAEHRNTIHFTGDAHSSWSILAAEITFTAQESGIAESYVSHDIGGFSGTHVPGDLYLRWIEFGAFSPILRIHGDAADRLPWQFPPKINAAATRFLRLREQLAPYLYTAARVAYDTGLSIVRPLYIDYPEMQNSYNFPQEYMFGSEMLVAPIATAGNTSRRNIWFPEGRWFNFFTGEEYRGPQIRMLDVPLDQMPVFVKAGSIIPLNASTLHVGVAKMPASVRVYPGASAEYKLYADAGEGLEYQRGDYSWRTFRYFEKASSRTLLILPASGSYQQDRIDNLEVIFEDAAPPLLVKLGNDVLPQIEPTDQERGYWFEPSSKSLHVRLIHPEGNEAISISMLEPH